MPIIVGHKIFLALMVAALTLVVIGCSSPLDEVTDILAANGFDVGEPTDEKLIYIGAPTAIGVDVNGQHILIYHFSNTKSLKEGVEAIHDILEAKTGFWETNVEKIEDNYYTKGEHLVFLGGHPDSDRIKSVLEDKLKVSTSP